MLLQSKSAFLINLEINHESGQYKLINRTAGSGLPEKINGVFDFLNGVLVALYAYSGNLIVRIGDVVAPLGEDINIEVTRKGSKQQLVLACKNNILSSLTYKAPDATQYKDDPTSFLDNEDLDFGTFISNVSKNTIRIDHCIRSWSLNS